MGTMSLRQDEAFIRGVRRPHLEAFQTKHPRKQFCHADIVVHDQDACVRGVRVSRRHCLIVVLEWRSVKDLEKGE